MRDVKGQRSAAAGTDDLQIRIYGPNVTAAHVTEVGEAFAAMFDAVAEGLGAKGKVGLEVVGVQWACDGCDGRVDGGEKPTDWLNAGGLDFCSRCQRERGL